MAKNKKMTFDEFQKVTMDFFEDYRWHYGLQRPRVWNKIPGNTMDMDMYYLLWQLRPGCEMVMFYDREEDKFPFSVFVDWRRGAFPHPMFRYHGQFVRIGEYSNMDVAMRQMIQEPLFYKAAEIHTCCLKQHYKDGENEDNTSLPVLRNMYEMGCSFVEIIDEIEYEKSIPDSVNKGLEVYVKHDYIVSFDYSGDEAKMTVLNEGDTIYETTI